MENNQSIVSPLSYSEKVILLNKGWWTIELIQKYFGCTIHYAKKIRKIALEKDSKAKSSIFTRSYSVKSILEAVDSSYEKEVAASETYTELLAKSIEKEKAIKIPKRKGVGVNAKH